MPCPDFDGRELDKESPRLVFLGFFVSLFLLIMDILMWIYTGSRTHRFPLSNVPSLAVLGILCFLFGRTIYRGRHQQKS